MVSSPRMSGGVKGAETRFMYLQDAVLEPQEFIAVTHTSPLILPETTLMILVPWPLEIDQPAGTVHEYEVAAVTGVILYTSAACP